MQSLRRLIVHNRGNEHKHSCSAYRGSNCVGQQEKQAFVQSHKFRPELGSIVSITVGKLIRAGRETRVNIPTKKYCRRGVVACIILPQSSSTPRQAFNLFQTDIATTACCWSIVVAIRAMRPKLAMSTPSDHRALAAA